MSKRSLVQGAVMTLIGPRLAHDAQVNISRILEGVTADNFKSSKTRIAADLRRSCRGKLAHDEDLDDVDDLLDALEEVDPTSAEAGVDEDLDPQVLAFLKSKLSPADLQEFLGLLRGEGGQDRRRAAMDAAGDVDGFKMRFPMAARIGCV
jgi:hypothetical protein